jgi:ABC-type branched-subunit amino acid transport system substrate-binding protein
LLRSGASPSRWLCSTLAVAIAIGATLGVLGTAAAGSTHAAGLTDDEIKIGIVHTKGAEQAAASIGAPGALVDFKAAFQTLIDDVNANGGVDGRKLVPVFFAFNPTAPVPVQEEEACTLFTQDDPVFAALISNVHTDTLLSCLKDAGVITIASPGVSSDDAATFKAHPEMAAAGTFDLTRSMSVLVDGLAKAKFFTKGAKIGVIHSDQPNSVRAVAVFEKRLKKLGVEVTEKFAITPDISSLSAGAAAAVLRFSTAGIDHVVNIGLNGPGTFLFMKQAESQGYKPKYGISSFDEPSGLTGVASPDSLGRTSGVGWFLANDVANPKASETGQHCLDLVNAAGGNLTNSYSVVAVLAYCDQLNIFKAGLEGGGGKSPNLKSFERGLAGLGNQAPESASLVGPLAYSKARRDGATTAQLLAYDAACDCFSYTGKPFTVK